MHYQFLIEDLSGAALVTQVMDKLQKQHSEREITFDIKSFKGIGGFKPGLFCSCAKTNKLLCDLDIYLKGFDNAFKHTPSYSVAIFIILDNDDREIDAFRVQLQQKAKEMMLSTDYVFCIAVEEMEAWLLGDRVALLKAYPNARQNILNSYVQDSICNTWEKLADAIYPGGLGKLKKDCPTYGEVGKCKSEWAKTIGCYMDLHNNVSPTFKYFIDQLEQRVVTS